MKKQIAENLRVRITGGGVAPGSVTVRVLSEVLEAVRQLAYTVSGEDGKKEVDDVHDSLHLVGKISSGSAVYRLAASHPDRAIAGLRLTGEIIDRPGLAEHHPNVLKPTEELSKVAKGLGCTIELYGPSDSTSPLAKIGPETYGELAATALVRGVSSITGTVVRVGGATKYSCALRVPRQPSRLVICRIMSQDLARELAQSLFKRVTASGEATWFRKTWNLHSFIIQSITAPRAGDDSGDSINALRAAGGASWDNIEDPDSYLANLRGE